MPEAKKPAQFTFKHGGKSYVLPPAADNAMKVPGWVVQSVLMDPTNQTAELTLRMHMLEVSKASNAAKAALRSMEAGEMLSVLDDWMGESEGSSV